MTCKLPTSASIGRRLRRDSSLFISWLLLMLAVIISAVACDASADRVESNRAGELVIYAASSLQEVFDDLALSFEQTHPDVDVIINFAGSSQLVAQLVEGAEADVVASADVQQMQRLIDSGLIDARSPVPFASNRLVVIVPDQNPAGIHSFTDLSAPGLRLITAAEDVPVRSYADQLVKLMPAEFAVAYYQNIASEEANVRQIVAKVALGEADAGIVYETDVAAVSGAHVEVFSIAESEAIEIRYPIAPLKAAPHPKLTELFIDLVLSRRGRATLERWGFRAIDSRTEP